ncbi:AAA family ATPase [Candidatus Woesearchaeota archaeon]|mgnify:FL=1|jgi:predicted ABC-type ATPase|nr:AAA family ATPase [Candidatus Woesearchaeota archaeon]MBT4110266.1 AAA family ATPase [Candidatus Woesearchaeota archaeon]MBT4336210.1 AAA family ATPase [Candidatus Woesearchaeota archaeon]MBT4468811.1 AAA family ATPase [Candidatus Woesearchaeota archaeon]MBT6744870.1 AAA family ATPase [Candidatus Woesearchaeota archaeon]
MPKLILIKGPAGVGKTTTCKHLSKKLKKFNYVNLEEFKEKFNHLERAERKIKAHSLYYPKIKNLIKKEKDILLQESFLKDLNKELGKELRTNKYKIISIFLKASLKETKKRNLKRKQKIASEEYMKKSYSYLAVPEEKDILIDVESISVKETVDLIINLLKN